MKVAHPLVLVEWEDAHVRDSDTWVEDQPNTWAPFIVQTVGFVLYDGPEGVMLVESKAPGMTGQRVQLPRGMIRSVTVLRK